MSKRGFWITMVASLAFLLLIIGAEQLLSASRSRQSAEPRTSRTTEILFAGHLSSYVSEAPEMMDDLGLYGPDAFVFGGDSYRADSEENESAFQAAVGAAEGIAGTVIVTKGNHDEGARVFEDRQAHGFVHVNDVQLIYLDTTVLAVESESCGVDKAQLLMLKEALRERAIHRVLMMHHALWAYDSYIDTIRPNTANGCAGAFWEEEVLPLIRGQVDVVVSGDGGAPTPFAMADRDGIRYVLSGSPVHDRVRGGNGTGGPSRAVFVRLSISGEGATVAPVTLAAPALVDESALEGVPTYVALVDETELASLYQTLPFYEVGTEWEKMIEPSVVVDQIKAPIQASVALDGAGLFDAELSIRGNVGNHWGPYKKSWDIEAVGGDGRQIKLVKPSDRRYVSQMYVQVMSDWLGVPTPGISVARLFINDHDMGVYLVYEDFDKAFIELNGYGADTDPSRNHWRDHFWGPSVAHSLPSVRVPGNSQDRTHQQRIAGGSEDPVEVIQWFERDVFARWLALQIFVGDTHQHEWDNFRFFADRSTGRFIMVTWDAWLGDVDGNVAIPSVIGQAFYDVPENKALTDSYVRDLVDRAPVFREQFVELGASLLPVFQADAALQASQSQIALELDAVLDRFDLNAEALEGF